MIIHHRRPEMQLLIWSNHLPNGQIGMDEHHRPGFVVKVLGNHVTGRCRYVIIPTESTCIQVLHALYETFFCNVHAWEHDGCTVRVFNEQNENEPQHPEETVAMVLPRPPALTCALHVAAALCMPEPQTSAAMNCFFPCTVRVRGIRIIC